MQLKFSSLPVLDPEHALQCYTSVLGFTKMADIPLGAYRWLTVTSPDGIAGVELVPEPMAFEPARVYQRALYEAGIPATAPITQDIASGTQRLRTRRHVPRHAAQRRTDPVRALLRQLRQPHQPGPAPGLTGVMSRLSHER